MSWTFEDFEKGKIGIYFPFGTLPEQVQFLEKCKARDVFWDDRVKLSADGLLPAEEVEFDLDATILVVYGYKKRLALSYESAAGQLLHCGYGIVQFDQLKED